MKPTIITHRPRKTSVELASFTLPKTAIPVPVRSCMHSTAQRITGRIAGVVVALVALGQVANLSIAAWFTFHGGLTSILHSSNATDSLTAWSSPFPGPGGAAIVAAQAASILIALVLALRARSAWRHVGHAILLSWILFWLCRIGHMAIVFGDGLHWGLAAICLLAAFAQITLWRAGPNPPTNARHHASS